MRVLINIFAIIIFISTVFLLMFAVGVSILFFIVYSVGVAMSPVSSTRSKPPTTTVDVRNDSVKYKGDA